MPLRESNVSLFYCCCCEIFLKWIAIEIALVKKAACAACIIKWTVCKLVFLRLSSSVLLSESITRKKLCSSYSCSNWAAFTSSSTLVKFVASPFDAIDWFFFPSNFLNSVFDDMFLYALAALFLSLCTFIIDRGYFKTSVQFDSLTSHMHTQ